ncbi:MAG: acetolactate synthase-1/2/3 large subunit [Parasphingorhabdus sp.]|jgi:acetolactate synthase-1/2/3 large subunit
MTKTVASLVTETLIEAGFNQLYCLPGVQNDDFFDALYDRQTELAPIHTRHEQGAAYMALGAYLATGKPQVFSVVPGPGFLNSCAALSTAYSLNAPLLALIGQIPSGAIGKGFGLLHEIPDQMGILKGLTKFASRITSGDDAASVLSNALSQLQGGRPRPIGIEVPVNIWKATVPSLGNQVNVTPTIGASVAQDKIEQAADLLRQSKRPLIVVGSGAQANSELVTRLAERLNAPVIAFRTGHGVISGSHPLCVGTPVGHELWRTTDTVIGLGTRLQTQQMQWGVDKDLQIIHIDIDAAEIGRINAPAIGINADIRHALPCLLDALSTNKTDRTDWLEHVATTKVRFQALYEEKLAPQLSWLKAIRNELSDDGILVDELTQVGYVSRFAYPVHHPRTFLSTGYQGTLGWGIATALGAAHARRDVPVVSIAGDGGALFNIAELATAAHHQIPLVSIIFNDNAFGNVRRFQIENYNNRPIASNLSSPDFVRLAESFGVRGLQANSPTELQKQLTHAFKSDGPTVIEVPVGEFPSPWEFILMPKVRG